MSRVRFAVWSARHVGELSGVMLSHLARTWHEIDVMYGIGYKKLAFLLSGGQRVDRAVAEEYS